MGRLFVLLFLLPWWVYVPASIGVFWYGERVYEQVMASEAGKAAALQSGAPAPVDLADFDMARDIHAADEVNVTGWIDLDRQSELVRQINGVPLTTRHLFPVFGNDGPGSDLVRAALLLDKLEAADFLGSKAEAWSLGARDAGQIIALNGRAYTDVALGDMIAETFAAQNLARSADFIVIAPFFEGREAALTPLGIPEEARYIGWAIAAAMALIGVVKRVRSVRARPSRAEDDAVDPGMVHELGATHEEDPAYARFDEPEPAYAMQETDGTLTDAEPAHDSGGYLGDEHKDRFPPMGEVGNISGPEQRSSTLAYVVKLGLGMTVVGGVAYDPSLIASALPFGGVALFLFGAYVVARNRRKLPEPPQSDEKPAPQHTRRPDGAAQPVAVGVGGRRIDLTAPVR